MATWRIKNWAKFQHFKDRTPPWVKLYRDILDDPDWHELDGESAKVLTMLWLIASEDETHQGVLPDSRRLSFRLRISESKLNQVLTKLSHWLIQDDIAPISDQYRSDAPERAGEETERERETDTMSGKPDAAAEIIEYLNERAGKHFRCVKATVSQINARLREASVQEIRAVIDDRVRAWGRDEKMAEYLRPATLFAASNFANYLGNLGADKPATIEQPGYFQGVRIAA